MAYCVVMMEGPGTMIAASRNMNTALRPIHSILANAERRRLPT